MRIRDNPQEIGEYLSAISNGAALHGEGTGYIVWGVEDGTHAVVGTKFHPRQAKKGNENLESWLLHQLDPRNWLAQGGQSADDASQGRDH